jgi:hypothetical protein
VSERECCANHDAKQIEIENHRKILHDSKELQSVLSKESLGYKALESLIEKESAEIVRALSPN